MFLFVSDATCCQWKADSDSSTWELFGIAEHYEKSAKVAIHRHPVVTEAKPRDFHRFMRRAGGGEGHELRVRNFRAVATMYKLIY